MLLISAVIRIGYAAQAIWNVVRDRELARQLPWRYLRYRARRDLRMQIQLLGILGAMVIYPMAFLLPDAAEEPTVIAGLVLWGFAIVTPWTERTVTRLRERR